MLVLSFLAMFLSYTLGTFAEGASYLPLRYTHTTGQADWYTCAAAVFTLRSPTTSPIC